MQKVHIEQVVPGMQTIQDVSDPQGRVLLKAHTVLDQRKLHALKAWGVDEIAIAGDIQLPDDRAPSTVPAQYRSAAESAIAERFALQDMNIPAVEAMREIAIDHLSRQLEQRGANTQR